MNLETELEEAFSSIKDALLRIRLQAATSVGSFAMSRARIIVH